MEPFRVLTVEVLGYDERAVNVSYYYSRLVYIARITL